MLMDHPDHPDDHDHPDNHDHDPDQKNWSKLGRKENNGMHVFNVVVPGYLVIIIKN